MFSSYCLDKNLPRMFYLWEEVFARSVSSKYLFMLLSSFDRKAERLGKRRKWRVEVHGKEFTSQFSYLVAFHLFVLAGRKELVLVSLNGNVQVPIRSINYFFCRFDFILELHPNFLTALMNQ